MPRNTPCLLPGCPGSPGCRRFCCGMHDVPTPKINGRPGGHTVSGLNKEHLLFKRGSVVP
eukprot:9238417-Pyramimonas_sp.AAC.1